MPDKVIVVVGATGGIGSAITHQLAKEGANLVLAARQSDRLATLTSQLPMANLEQVLNVPTDITDPAQVETLMQKAVDKFGQIDVLINAAGGCWT